MAEIATAYVSLITKMPGVKSDIAKSLGGAGDEAGRTMGKQLGSGILNSVKSVVAPVAGLFAVGAAANIFRGFASQAGDAADATIKFQSTLNFAGMGRDQINSLTDSVQKYADQTVYGLSDIQNITAQLAANHVQGYEQMAQAAGNLNAIAGGNADTFKSVGMVLTQTAGAGKLTTENWNQLADAIPGASGMLQDAMLKNGAYTGNFRDAMEKGQITADEFNQAIMQLGMTDAAKQAATSTSTIEGAMGNLKASVQGGLSKMISEAMPGITGSINALNDLVSFAFKGMGDGMHGPIEWFNTTGVHMIQSGVDKLESVLSKLPDAWRKITAGFDSTKAAIAGVAAVFTGGGLGGVITGLLGHLGSAGGVLQELGTHVGVLTKLIPGLGGPLGMVVSLFTDLVGKSPELRMAIVEIAKNLGGVLLEGLKSAGPIFDALKGVFVQLAPVLGQVAQTLGGALGKALIDLMPSVTTLLQLIGNTLVTVLPPVIQVLGQLAATILPVLANLIATVLPPVVNIVNALVQGLAPIITQLIQALLPPILTLLSALGPLFQALGPVVGALAQVIGQVLTVAIQALLPVVQMVFQALEPIISTALNVVTAVIRTVTAVLSGDWSGAWNGIKDVFSGIWNLITGIVNTALSLITTVLQGAFSFIAGIFSTVWGGIKDTVAGVWDGITHSISDGINSAVDWIGKLSGRLMGAVGDANHWLVDVGNNIVQGLIDGLESMMKSVADVAGKIGKGVLDAAKAALGIHSPSTEFYAVGDYSVQGLTNALDDGQGRARKAGAELAKSTLPGPVEFPSVTAAKNAAANGALGAGPNVTLNVHNPVTETPSESIRAAASTLVLAGAL